MARGTFLLCAGGTGGHLFPAEALAHELISRGWDVQLATDERAGRYAGTFPAVAVHEIPSSTIGSRNPIALARAFWTIWRGARQAGKVIGDIKPRAVIGFGGYPTLPPLWAATRRGVPTIIHEQNAVMGRANKALAGRVTAIAGGFLDEKGSHAGKIVVTGNPVRPSVVAASRPPFIEPAADTMLELLVFGGSQGARFFSDVVPEAVGRLPGDLLQRLRVTQQARPEDEARVRERYRDLGVIADVKPFFADLPDRMANAHLVIARAGASTVLELSVIGRPSILVPLPHALDDDQGHNAAILVNAGGAVMRRQPGIDPDNLASEIAGLLGDPARLATFAAAARGVGRTDATRLLADLAEAIASGESVAAFKGRVRA